MGVAKGEGGGAEEGGAGAEKPQKIKCLSLPLILFECFCFVLCIINFSIVSMPKKARVLRISVTVQKPWASQ